MAENVQIDDDNLVFLYRYTSFDTDETLDSMSESTVYNGLNTMSISGGNLQKIVGPGAAAPSSSGAEITGFSTAFHLPASNQSGNASGVEVQTGSEFTFGGWFKVHNNWTNQRALFSNFAFGSQMRRYQIECNSGSKFEWRIRTGQSNGGSTVTVTHDDTITAGEWMHVVGRIDGSTSTNNVRIYVSGILGGSGSATFDPGDSNSGNHPGIRIGAGWSSASESLVNAITVSSGAMAETFFMNRLLTDVEIDGVYQSGFQAAAEGEVSDSDTNDLQKDNIPSGNASSAIIRSTAWNGTERANPSGARHATSGFHPAFIKVLDIGGGSGLSFGDVKQNTPSNPKVITFVNTTTGTIIDNMKFWASDLSAFNGIVGYEISQHINSKWIPNLVLPSGSGITGKTLAAASSILRSDLNTQISGYEIDGTVQSGEQEVSQYIYLAFDTSNDFTPNTYGYSGFVFRITSDTITD